MKFHTFVAANDQKAIAMVYAMLGAEALIYQTRSVAEGIEILAGLPDDGVEPLHSERKHSNSEMFEKLNEQLRLISEKVGYLSKRMNVESSDNYEISDDEYLTKRNFITYQLNKMGFNGKFSQKFINNYFVRRNISDPVTVQNIEIELLSQIKTLQEDVVDTRNVCALIGPTGIGKTTTILKLAKRYIARYGSSSIGIITTDFNDIAGKNLLLHYRTTHNIDVEIAENASQLAFALDLMKKKRFVLIDTHGVGQRDTDALTKLTTLLESQGDKVSTFITLPCNVQEPILDDIAKVFKTSNFRGCILTKQDESMSLAPAIGVCIKYEMKIAYLCNGKDITKDIELADAEKIVQHIMHANVEKKIESENHVSRNTPVLASKRTVKLDKNLCE